MDNEFKKNRIWLSLSRCGNFSEKDKTIFRIFPIEYEKNLSVDSFPKFIEADDVETARLKVHQFVDKIFNDYWSVRTSNEKLEAKSSVVQPSLPMDSLSIGTAVQSDTLLNLKDLL